ncbi:hypothetical protein AVEN_254046-1 [Araneus ventricosus]|uniref:Uncharacterized protein n=1 Tax=Araneus ventricosus TaxID=182803 RepID=A0A4Y2BZR7_ARAVE|nr:hypothetical protein AVEN_254046-1 [Araneus ventricosus]
MWIRSGQWMINYKKMISFPTYTADFQLPMFQKATQIFSMLRRLKIHLFKSRIKNEVPLPHQQCHQLMSRLRIHHRQSNNSSMKSPPVPTSPRQIPRRFGRIRHPPKRLDL